MTPNTQAFPFDTSGEVILTGVDAGDLRGKRAVWPDLTPFQQGYVEAAFASLRDPESVRAHGGFGGFGFSDLSPEALALILNDCETWCSQKSRGNVHADPLSTAAGRSFWSMRNHPFVRDGASYPEGFPPLTAYLSDDGKVRLRERDQ